MAISNTTNNQALTPAAMEAEVIKTEEASPPSTLSLLMLQMKEKLKNVPIWPMAVTMIGASLLGFAFMAGTPFSLPLLISGAIFLGLGMSWIMSSQIAKGLGIGSNQENDEDNTGQASATPAVNEEPSVSEGSDANERRASEAPSQTSQTDNQANQERENAHNRQSHRRSIEQHEENQSQENRRSRQTQINDAYRRNAERREEQREENEKQEDQRRNNNRGSSAYHLRFEKQKAKLKAFEEKPKARKEDELPRSARDNLAFDSDYDEDDFEDFCFS